MGMQHAKFPQTGSFGKGSITNTVTGRIIGFEISTSKDIIAKL